MLVVFVYNKSVIMNNYFSINYFSNKTLSLRVNVCINYNQIHK